MRRACGLNLMNWYLHRDAQTDVVVKYIQHRQEWLCFLLFLTDLEVSGCGLKILYQVGGVLYKDPIVNNWHTFILTMSTRLWYATALNYLPTPTLTHHFAHSETLVLTLDWGRGVWAVCLLTWPEAMRFYGNERNCQHKKGIRLPKDWFGSTTWPLVYCFRTPIWPRDVMQISSL